MLATGEFASPEAPNAKVMTFVVEFAPGAVIPKHSHGGTGQVLVLEGDIALAHLDGTKATYHKGDVFVEEAGDVHEGTIGDAPAQLVWTIVLPEGAELETAYSE